MLVERLAEEGELLRIPVNCLSLKELDESEDGTHRAIIMRLGQVLGTGVMREKGK